MTSTHISRLYTIGIALLSFGAVYWPAALGSLASSPGVLLIAATLLFAPSLPYARMPIFTHLHLRWLLWLPVLGSAISFVIFGWSTLFFGKFFSLGLLSLIWLSPLLLVDVLQIAHVKRAVLMGLVVCTAGYVFADLLHDQYAGLTNLFFGSDYLEFPDARPRGFSEEPSQFSALVARFLFIYYIIHEVNRPYSKTRLLSFLAALSVLLVALGSKGAVAAVAIAVLSFSLSRRQLPYLALVMPMGAWLVSTQLSAIMTDLEQFSSASTRIGMTLTGAASIATNPVGYGYYGYYGAIQSFGGRTIDWLSVRSPLLLGEMTQIVDDLTYVSTKSTMLDFMMVFGWFFIWLAWRIGSMIELRDPRARAMTVYFLISAFSTSGHLSISLFLGFAMLLRLYPRKIVIPRSRFRTMRPTKQAGTAQPSPASSIV